RGRPRRRPGRAAAADSGLPRAGPHLLPGRLPGRRAGPQADAQRLRERLRRRTGVPGLPAAQPRGAGRAIARAGLGAPRRHRAARRPDLGRAGPTAGGRPMTHRVAVVGIDGAGKSSIMARLRELAPAAGPSAFASMTCPDFHNTRDVPLTDLSRQLKAFSVGCDEISSVEMKATAMYLQMTLFGPVERHFLDTWDPDVLIFARHPLIELLVYGPLYVALAGPEWDGHQREHEIAAVLERHEPGTFDTLLA